MQQGFLIFSCKNVKKPDYMIDFSFRAAIHMMTNETMGQGMGNFNCYKNAMKAAALHCTCHEGGGATLYATIRRRYTVHVMKAVALHCTCHEGGGATPYMP